MILVRSEWVHQQAITGAIKQTIISLFLSFLQGTYSFSQTGLSEILHGLLNNKNIRIPTNKIPFTLLFFVQK